MIKQNGFQAFAEKSKDAKNLNITLQLYTEILVNQML